MNEVNGGDEPTGGDLNGTKSATDKSNRRKARAMYPGINVLRTESKDDLAKLRDEAIQEIGPRNFIERRSVEDVVSYTWDIMRYRRIINGIINNALSSAVKQILHQIQLPPTTNSKQSLKKLLASENAAYEWLFDRDVKQDVSSVLAEFGYDESAIEAEAFRLVADDLEQANRLLRFAEVGRDRSLRSIVKYRKSFADIVERFSDRVLAADERSRVVN